MELSEVVNVQFAVPVLGVIVCAVLVFAFGFKSPGQPPNFDALTDDDRKSKRGRSRRSAGIHADRHKNAAGASSASDDEETANHSTASKSNSLDGSKQQLNGVPVSGSSRTVAGSNVEILSADRLNAKLLKPGEESKQPAEMILKEDRSSVGGWTTAVSKKDKKNRGRKDENTKPEKSAPEFHKPAISKVREKFSRNPKKLSELTTVTVVVPGPPMSNSSVTETSTTITETAVIKVRVVPSVRVSVGTHQMPNGHAVMEGRAVPKPSARSASTVAPWAKLDTDATKSADAGKPILILGFDDWTEVQSSRSPKKKRGNVEEQQEKSKDAGSSSATDHSEEIYNELPRSSPSVQSKSDGVVRDEDVHSSPECSPRVVVSASRCEPKPAGASPPSVRVVAGGVQNADQNQTRSAAGDLSSDESPSSVDIPDFVKHSSKGDETKTTGNGGSDSTGACCDAADTTENDEELAGGEGNADGGQSAEKTGEWKEAKPIRKKRKSKSEN